MPALETGDASDVIPVSSLFRPRHRQGFSSFNDHLAFHKRMNRAVIGIRARHCELEREGIVLPEYVDPNLPSLLTTVCSTPCLLVQVSSLPRP